MSKSTSSYPIGKPGTPWEAAEKQLWLQQQSKQRSYQDEVLKQLRDLDNDFHLKQYGKLSYAGNSYPLMAVLSANWQAHLPSVLITGGVHGYETSGVQGAIRFVLNVAKGYQSKVNLMIFPCVSPWGYETINRWNPMAVDPNRSFVSNSPAPESAAVMAFLQQQKLSFILHIDLHETTDTDNSTFRPALAARDGISHDNWNIPDGFYLVGDSTKPADDFQKAIINAVAKVTHIAPADSNNQLIGVPLAQFGVVNYEARALGLCMGLTDAPFVTTTEVYPDSPKVDDENCIDAQVAAITSAINFVLDNISE